MMEDEYFDEYEYLYDEDVNTKRRPKPMKDSEGSNKKKKVKNFKYGSKQELWDKYTEDSEEDYGKEILRDIKKDDRKKSFNNNNNYNNKNINNNRQQPINNNKGGNYILRGTPIDLNNVVAILKVDNVHNGNKTFGIKFNFKNKDEENRTYRIIWYNQNEKDRDDACTKITKIWADKQNRPK